jgi:hypothetical protein
MRQRGRRYRCGGPAQNPAPGEALTCGERFSPVPNINLMCESCGEPKASGAGAIFHAAGGGFFAAQMWQRFFRILFPKIHCFPGRSPPQALANQNSLFPGFGRFNL